MAKRKKNAQQGHSAPIVEASIVRATSSILTLDGRQIGIKSTGNPFLDRFMGIASAEGYTFRDDPQGLKLAFLSSAWAMRCVTIKANTIGGIPLRFLNASEEDLEPTHDLVRAFSPGRRGSPILRRTTQHLNIYGAAYLIPKHNDRRMPFRLMALNPLTIEVEADRTGILGFWQRVDGQLIDVWAQNELVYIYDFDPDNDLGGLSPTAWLLRTIGLDASLEQFAKVYFENDAAPAGLLTTEQQLQPADAARMSAEWERKFKGVDNAHRVGVLGKGASYVPITPPLKDLALPELDEKTMRRIAGAYGVPMTIAGMTDSANYAVSKEQRLSFYTETILPELDLILDAINEQLCPRFGDGVHIVPDTDNIEALQEDRTEVTQRARDGFVGGFRSFNEAREMDGLEPLSADFFVIPGIGLVSRKELEEGTLPEPPAPAQNPFGFPLLPGSSTQSTVVDTAPEQKALVTLDTQLDLVDLTPSCAILLNLANHPDLIQAAQRVRDQHGYSDYLWTPPSEYHVTLVYVKRITPEQLEKLLGAFSAHSVPAMTLRICNLGAFNNDRDNSLHFVVELDPVLADFQRTLYDLAAPYGEVSEYSHPANYTPHMTLAYSEQPIEALPELIDPLHVEPYGAYLSSGYGTEYVVLSAIKCAAPEWIAASDTGLQARTRLATFDPSVRWQVTTSPGGETGSSAGVKLTVTDTSDVITTINTASTLFNATMLPALWQQDLDRWEKKALKRGATVAFKPDYLPSAYADFLRMDLASGKPVKDVFAGVSAAIKQVDTTLSTPEEFEAYWQGIGELYNELSFAALAGLQSLPVVDAIRTGNEDTLAQAEATMAHLLEDVLVKLYLAGAARGNALIQTTKAVDASITWDVLNEQARAWAKDYAASQVRYIGDTTRTAIREVSAAWTEHGGTTQQLADLIEGKLNAADMTIPEGFSTQKIAWLTSPERASLIAQTESTEVFHNGVQARWQQVGVRRMKWRNNNDALVCPLCKRMNNVVGEIGTGFIDPETGNTINIPAHPGDRCFASPVVD